MLYLLLLTIVATIAAGNEEAQPAESAQPIRVHDDERGYRFEDGLELIRRREERQRKLYDEQRDYHLHGRRGPQRIDINEEEHSGPVILRTLDPHNPGHIDIERQNKVIADAYAPDYFQPTWILDYRYLKTGGRDYTRSPGGQILILPKNVRTNEHKEYSDFDSLLEHLRLSRLAERARNSGYADEHDARRTYHNVGREHQQSWQRANRHH